MRWAAGMLSSGRTPLAARACGATLASRRTAARIGRIDSKSPRRMAGRGSECVACVVWWWSGGGGATAWQPRASYMLSSSRTRPCRVTCRRACRVCNNFRRPALLSLYRSATCPTPTSPVAPFHSDFVCFLMLIGTKWQSQGNAAGALVPAFGSASARGLAQRPREYPSPQTGARGPTGDLGQ